MQCNIYGMKRMSSKTISEISSRKRFYLFMWKGDQMVEISISYRIYYTAYAMPYMIYFVWLEI